MEPAQQEKKQYEWLKPTQWKKGQSGNPKGKKPGKSLKTFVREYLESLPDEQKLEYLKHISPEIAWKMAEGNPAQDVGVGGQNGKDIVIKFDNAFTHRPEGNSIGQS